MRAPCSGAFFFFDECQRSKNADSDQTRAVKALTQYIRSKYNINHIFRKYD